MTLVMTALHRTLPQESSRELPPRVITENAVGPAMNALKEEDRDNVSLLAHFGFGATAGAGYVAFAGKTTLPYPVEGALYGLAIWGGAYLGLMPASGLYRSAMDDTKSRNFLMVSAHVVWGAALGLLWSKLAKPSEHIA